MAPPSQQPSSDTAVRIRLSALRLFATRGYEATGIRDVARDVGLSLSTIYHHVGSKEDLLVAIATAAMEDLRDAAEEALAGATSQPERLAALVEAHVLVHGRHQLEAIVSDNELRALSEPSRKGAVKLRDRYETLWQQVLDDGVASGDFFAEDTRLVRLALLQMCTGVAYWYSAAGDRSLEHIAKTFADLSLAMVNHAPQTTEEAPGR